MQYSKLLREKIEESNSIVCVGLDPALERIPIEEINIEKKITKFYFDIFDACVSEKVLPAAIKPNIAFYEQFGFPALRALQKIIQKAKEAGIVVILDAKRGDIGKTSVAYAKAVFNFWGADATTVAPYMGHDSVQAFVKHCEEKGKGAYILNRTSNKGAADFQNLKIGNEFLYKKVSEKIVEWGKNADGNLGAVVGATSLKELGEIAKYFSKQKNSVPLLIPGVGAQGGSAAEVVKTLQKVDYDLKTVLINSSSGINYAYEKEKTDDYAGAAVRAIKKLNSEINLKL